MEKKEAFYNLNQALIDLDDLWAVDLTRKLLELRAKPIDILTTCEQSLMIIGEKYASGEYYISGLIMAGEMMTSISELLTPHLVSPASRPLKGMILIGTVEGDIHDLGKNIAGALLAAYGFNVVDLGVDVSVDEFINKCQELKPDIVGLSALLGSCYPALEKTVAALKEWRGKQIKPAIFISGAQITEEHRCLFGADYQVKTSFDTVKICEDITRGD